VEVKGSNLWKEKDMSKIEDLKTLEKTFDWTFSTPYKGTISSISSVYDKINAHETQIDQILTVAGVEPSKHSIKLDHSS